MSRSCTDRATVACVALAGLCAAAPAQGVTLNFSADRSTATIGDTITWTVTASFTGLNDHSAYFGGFVGSLIAENAQDFEAGGFVNLMSGEGTAPVANEGSVSSLNIFNSALLGTDDSSNPLQIFRFQTTLVEIEPGFDTIRFVSFDAIGTASVFQDSGIFTLPLEFRDGEPGFSVASDRLMYTPAPGSVVVLSGAMLCGARRRLAKS